jgi:hypothetical protein
MDGGFDHDAATKRRTNAQKAQDASPPLKPHRRHVVVGLRGVPPNSGLGRR